MKKRWAPTSSLFPYMPLECVNLASGYDVMIWNWYLMRTKINQIYSNCIGNACIYGTCTRICKPMRSLIEIHALINEKSGAESLNRRALIEHNEVKWTSTTMRIHCSWAIKLRMARIQCNFDTKVQISLLNCHFTYICNCYKSLITALSQQYFLVYMYRKRACLPRALC